MSDIKRYWNIIENFLKITNIDVYNSLLDPAEKDNIKELENILKINLPDTFKESLLIHNGQAEDNNLIAFIDYQKLLSVEKIIENYKMFCGLFGENETIDWININECKYIKRNYIYNHNWLKFTDSDGDGLIIDFDPAKNGEKGQIFFRPHDDNPSDIIIAESYEKWLEKICIKFENKEYKISEFGCIIFDNFTYNY